jgi:hypothetical protein
MIRVILKEKGEVTKVLPRLSQRLRAALLQAMKEAAVLIQSLAKLNAPVFRGMLRVSIAQNVAEDGARIVGEVGSGLPYASVVEDGRNPWAGRQPPSGPGSDLRTWARRKLGDERLAFVVARAIKRRGFRAQPYLRPALLGATPRVQAIFQTRILDALQQEGGTA